MGRLIKWVVLALGSPIAFSVGCSTIMRDALLTGAIDYVSGSTTGALGSLLPLNELLDAALGR